MKLTNKEAFRFLFICLLPKRKIVNNKFVVTKKEIVTTLKRTLTFLKEGWNY